MVDDVLRGVRTHWAGNPWVDFRTWVTVTDPDNVVASVTGMVTRPDGETFDAYQPSLKFVKDRRSQVWSFDPAAYWKVGPDHAAFGTWTFAVTAFDRAGRPLSSNRLTVLARDPKTAAHPRFVSIKTGKRQVRRAKACPPDSDKHPYCMIRAKMTFSDPDHVLRYTFMYDKGPRWHSTSNWVTARVRRTGDLITFTDTVPVSGVSGRHRLYTKRPSVGEFWKSSYVRGLHDPSMRWRLTIKR